jgi:hypothetical protein
MISPTDSTPGEVLPFCPLCGGPLELVANRHTQKVCVCIDCRLSINIPARAWDVARAKREVNSGSDPDR